jgi:hypothetical protein
MLYMAPETLYPVRIRLTQKDGSPGPEYRFRMPQPRDVVIGDADADGKSEIVLIESTTNRIKVYRLQPVEKRQESPFEFGSVELIPLAKDEKSAMRDFAIGDLDANGTPDFLITDPGAARMTLLRCEKGKGFLPPESFPCLQEVSAVAIGSMGQGGARAFLLSRKEGILGVSEYDAAAGRMSYPQPIELPGKPLNIAVRPAGKDGPEALICLLSDTSEGETTKTAKLSIAIIEATDAGYEVKSTQEATGLDAPPERLLALDVNSDGRTDLLALRQYESAVLFVQSAEGKFENVSQSPQFRKELVRGLASGAVLSAVLQKGGQPMLLVCKDRLVRAVSFESGNLVVKDQFSSSNPNADYQALASGDLDGDGNAEILVLDAKAQLLLVLKRNEKGVYEVARQLEIGPFATLGLRWVDLDGDGTPEILVVGKEKIGVLWSTKAAKELTELASIETDQEGVVYAQVLIGDLNGDGKNDLVLRDVGKNQIEIYDNRDGEGWKSRMRFKVFESRTFGGPFGGREASGIEPRELVLADLTADGLTDMAVIAHDRVIVYPQQP